MFPAKSNAVISFLNSYISDILNQTKQVLNDNRERL